MSTGDAGFEAPLVELRRQIEELERYPDESGRKRELARLRSRLRRETEALFASLTPWQTALIARHADRPFTLDYVQALMSDWVEIHGDRAYGDDPAIVAGLADFRGRPVVVVGHQKGRSTRERIRRNFGQPRPEGYRKALRAMQLAERFRLPILSFVDTPGAYPGIEAEERGQAEAIARNLLEMAVLRVPIVVTVTGEGGSGGALAVGIGDRILMLEHAVYSVISPEGCAAILWKDQGRKEEAAAAMRITAPELLRLGVIDAIVPEPLGGAHADPQEACTRVGEAIAKALRELSRLAPDKLVTERRKRFRHLGAFLES
ncbi:MAG: acetyl-CoA carboxylase carboxyltransferase subunit alpha [Acidobacteria bacterium]|jgi:acetyl-CoA carboxylase carboxyl transferase subunit alpha|nr:acetyl-CoA carboxylase carboxyltransferase subunit alpha [Thermoanaerobaculia bacterium]MDI9630754.1 acetyl-CoA carboxylase carboxyltransferase subunit alpha [Acidobacteriota bacterium]OQC40557.1 MAG: Acetyl-coenzyme A carboxylase carboxyl transferase subunit alpha [Acidobacteria bacterium ADurb.Bin051]MBP7813956.1 acetyl-CoA carboxylase carboxyltransferase subunit alpha [Thermoanaerobaculia bacterium]MBP8846143.1 acetyl-CoA carboxylase carboxyltransferase subunit alpha [Thermoanaerobaculia 